MAISTTNLVPVDFETIKENLKTYLRNQTIFKDIDFDASNISVLLDVLAYNTYHNSFYLNMMASEMFLDTAQLQSSVASHAKTLNYLPRSYRSAKATVQIEVKPANPSTVESILIPKGSSFTGRANSKVFTFTTNKNVVVVNNSNKFVAESVDLYEGRYLSDVFTYTSDGKYVISNPFVDTTSIAVVISESGKVPTEFTRATSFVGVASTDEVYFIQPTENGQYEIIFGDDMFGRRPTAGATIIIEYRTSSGELPNTAAMFDSDGTIGGSSDITITVVDAATGGAVAETTDEVRFRAPLTYSTQQRAVTTSDYKTLIQNEFPDISDVGVFGGEDLSPPRFGHVAVAMVSDAYDAITAARAADVMEFLRTKCPITVTPFVIDPEFSFLQLTTNILYDPTLTTKSAKDLELLVLASIKNYSDENINGFNRVMYYSKLLAAVDGSDESIVSNDTTVKIYRKLLPSSTKPFETTIDFGNALYDGATMAATHNVQDSTGLYSTYFTFDGLRCMFEDDGNGNVVIVTLNNNQHAVIKSDAGTVDYATGRVVLTPGIITSYEGSGIRLYAVTKSKDISAVRNTVLVVKDSDINIVVSSLRG